MEGGTLDERAPGKSDGALRKLESVTAQPLVPLEPALETATPPPLPPPDGRGIAVPDLRDTVSQCGRPGRQ